jgi:hypothetical protein
MIRDSNENITFYEPNTYLRHIRLISLFNDFSVSFIDNI